MAASVEGASFARLLDDLQAAAAKRGFWEDHGTRRDGKLEAAQEREREARAAVLGAHRAALTQARAATAVSVAQGAAPAPVSVLWEIADAPAPDYGTSARLVGVNPILEHLYTEAVAEDGREGITETGSTAAALLAELRNGSFDQAHTREQLRNADEVLVRFIRKRREALDSAPRYEKCGACHLFIEPNFDHETDPSLAAFLHLHTGSKADEALEATHDAIPSGEVHGLGYWREAGPQEMRARFI